MKVKKKTVLVVKVRNVHLIVPWHIRK
jgi:hypothetical protein